MVTLQKRRACNAGFTLVELMVVLVVAAILAGVVAPGFQEMIRNNRITADVNHFVAAAYLARSEALKTGGAVILQPVSGANWNTGWIVGEVVSGGVNAIKTFSKDSDVMVNATMNSVRYTSRGTIDTVSGTVQFCDARVGETGRQVTVGFTGRVATDEFVCP